MSYEDIRVKKGGRIATITVDRPNVLNATRHETMLEIDRALNDVEADEKRRWQWSGGHLRRPVTGRGCPVKGVMKNSFQN